MERHTEIFRMLVSDAMRASPPRAAPTDDLTSVVSQMTHADASGVVITDDEGRPLGIVTERDVTRRAAFHLPGETPATDIMTQPVQCIAHDEYLYHAIALMRRQDLRHMPVVDANGALTGMLNLHDTLGVASKMLMTQLDSLTREDSVEGLIQVKQAQVELADQLFHDNVPAPEIQALLSHINLDIYNRVVRLNMADMKAEGMGGPPVGFQVIVMGSGGRGESFLFPDQDNGFILEDYPDDRHTEVDAWFINLAERMVRDMDRVGLTLCKGFVMATNPLWRKTISQWKDQIAYWSRKGNSITLRHCDIFFDFIDAYTSTASALDMTDTLRAHVTETARGNKDFLRQMYASDPDGGPALGWFRRFKTMKESDPPGYKGYLNLKHSGTLPLVEGMRLMCLRQGLKIIPTLERIAALQEESVLKTDEADYLSGGYRHISTLLLRQQIKDFEAGEKVTNFVHPNSLTQRETDMLKDSFEAIASLQDRLRLEFTGNVF